MVGKLVEDDINTTVAEGMLLGARVKRAEKALEAIPQRGIRDSAAQMGPRDANLADGATAGQSDGFGQRFMACGALKQAQNLAGLQRDLWRFLTKRQRVSTVWAFVCASRLSFLMRTGCILVWWRQCLHGSRQTWAARSGLFVVMAAAVRGRDGG